jgi:hypothetical protein
MIVQNVVQNATKNVKNIDFIGKYAKMIPKVKSGGDLVLARMVFHIFDLPKHEYVAICKAN